VSGFARGAADHCGIRSALAIGQSEQRPNRPMISFPEFKAGQTAAASLPKLQSIKFEVDTPDRANRPSRSVKFDAAERRHLFTFARAQL
jgi:hypothetical protein